MQASSILPPALAVILILAGAPTPSQAQTAPDPALLAAPKDGGARRWEVTGDSAPLRASPSEGANTVATLSQGAILSNMGCAGEGDTVWCDVRPFRGGARGFVAAAQLQPASGPDGIVPVGSDTSKIRARKRIFDATGQIACAQEQGQSLGKCKASVARGDGGDATLVVTFPNGFARDLFFVHGEFVRASATMSGVGTDNEWRLEGRTHLIRVDDQRFEIPGQFVFGD